MKNTFLTILFALSLISCEKSNEEKAKEAIHTFLNENLDDMSSYEAVKFGTLDSINKPDKSYKTNRFDLRRLQPSFPELQMFHSYRIMGDNGHKILYKSYFWFDNKLKVISERDYPQPEFWDNTIDADTSAAE
jgi:hypothetical protein